MDVIKRRRKLNINYSAEIGPVIKEPLALSIALRVSARISLHLILYHGWYPMDIPFLSSLLTRRERLSQIVHPSRFRGDMGLVWTYIPPGVSRSFYAVLLQLKLLR